MAHNEPEQWLQDLELYESFVRDARPSKALRGQVIEKGLIQYVNELKGQAVSDSPVVLCAAHRAGNEYFVANSDGTISPEARKDLALGVSEHGAVILVKRSDVPRCMRFGFQAAVAHAGEPPAGREPSELVLISHPGRGLAVSQEKRYVDSMKVESLILAPLAHAFRLVLNGNYLQRQDCHDQVVHFGDPQRERERRQNGRLFAAVEHGDAQAVAEMLACGGNVNCMRDTESLGHVAAREGHLNVLELLLGHGFNVNMGIEHGGSTLIEAATYGHVDCVRRLLTVKDIDVNVREDSKTALGWAQDPSPHGELTEDHAEIARLLAAAEAATVLGAMRQMGQAVQSGWSNILQM